MPPRGVKKGTKRARAVPEHIKGSLREQGRSEDMAEEIAARTVNKERARSGEAATSSRLSKTDISSGRRGGLRSNRKGASRPHSRPTLRGGPRSQHPRTVEDDQGPARSARSGGGREKPLTAARFGTGLHRDARPSWRTTGRLRSGYGPRHCAPHPRHANPVMERTVDELLLAYHREGDKAARDQALLELLPLVRALANRYAGRGEPLEDLVQVGSSA